MRAVGIEAVKGRPLLCASSWAPVAAGRTSLHNQRDYEKYGGSSAEDEFHQIFFGTSGASFSAVLLLPQKQKPRLA